MNLNELSLKELKELQVQVTKAISGFEDRRKKEALEALEARARDLGFSLAELTGATVSRKRQSSVAKFANPENPADTWTGRGRKPRWYEAALAAGKEPEELAI